MNITDEQVEAALDFLRDGAIPSAKARAERLYVEEYRKTIKAQIMKETDESGVIQERNAYADDRYIRHLDAIREAVFEDEKLRFLRGAAEAKIEAWRTMKATERAMKL